ncbi:MAG: sulfotransferase family 2 domain-containing protein [Microcoleaceae cyanobacterium]
MNRLLRYGAETYGNLLKKNSKHQLAMKHALRIYRSNAIYSFIPKNACSTMRLSLALENQCIKDKADFNWIHQNNDTFSADLASLITADYTFVILRCPYSRLASCYLDKIVDRSLDSWILQNLTNHSLDLSKVSFEVFIKLMKKAAIKKGNIHWQPQIDFLVYEEYDDYFCLEEFGKAVKTLQEKIELSVVDARDLTKHGSSQLKFVEDTLSEGKSYANLSPDNLFLLKRSGKCPAPKLLYNEELIEIVQDCYQQDIALYSDIFGSKNLMFS